MKTTDNDLLQSQALEAEQERRIDEVNVAFSKEDYTTSFPVYQELAKEGNPRALFNCGVSYANGFGVKKNPKRAIQNYVDAAKTGLLLAYPNLGALFSENDDFPKNMEEECGTEILIAYNNLMFADNAAEFKRLTSKDEAPEIQIDNIKFYQKDTELGECIFVLSANVQVQGYKGREIEINYFMDDSTQAGDRIISVPNGTWKFIVPYNAVKWTNLPTVEYDDSFLHLKKNEERVFILKIEVLDCMTEEKIALAEKSFRVKYVKPFFGKPKWEISEV